MNRSILIVICDFLLISLLVFSAPDASQVNLNLASKSLHLEMVTNQADSGRDLAAAMRVALDEERKGREELQNQLAKTRQDASTQQSDLAQQLAARDQQARALQQQLQARDQQARQFQQQEEQLQQQYIAAQTNIQALTQRLQNVSSDTVLSQEKIAAMEDQLRKQAEQAAALQKHINELNATNEQVRTERLQLAGELKVADAERRSALAQAAQMQEEVKVERAEKAKLAENVQVLASKSGELAKEVHDNRELAPNTIFSDIVTNRIEAGFTASRPSLFGDSVHRKDTETVLVSDGVHTFAICHLQDTPLTFFNPGIDWKSLTGTLASRMTVLPVRGISFQKTDPRVILVPVSDAEARQLGTKVYRISADPYKFQNAVLINASGGYYGECRFEIDLSTPQYVKLDRSFIKGLFGKFNPSSGDLVLSHNGEVMGMMVNGTYCLMLQDLGTTASFQFGNDVTNEHTGQTLAKFYSTVQGMPFKLQ